MESQICATLKSIQARLPGIETYQRIYQKNGEPDERLKLTIIDAYDCFIEFCIAAVTFYTKGSFCELLCQTSPLIRNSRLKFVCPSPLAQSDGSFDVPR